jgi:hypothetical protein
VAERTIEAPFGVIGDCSRQNGPSRLASVSVWPSELLSRQTSEEMPSEPAISTASLCDSLLALPSATT